MLDTRLPGFGRFGIGRPILHLSGLWGFAAPVAITPGRSAVESRLVPENPLLVKAIRRSDAGIEGKVASTQEYDEVVFDAVIAVNLKGVFLGLRHVLPVMLKHGHGAVVNTASVAGLFGALRSGAAKYLASGERQLWGEPRRPFNEAGMAGYGASRPLPRVPAKVP